MPITLQYDHRLNSSFLFWIEDLIQNKGQAHSLVSGMFYDTQEVFAGRFSYSFPYQPFIANSNINGATVLTGVWLDRTFITTGVSGLTGINYSKGMVYFNSGISYTNNPAHTRLSGVASISDFSFKLTSEPEETLLFETKYFLKSKTYQNVTGLGPSDATYPVIFVKPNSSRNREWALGGQEETIHTIRLVILADSQYAVDGVTSLVRDRTRCVIPLITGINEMPFNSFGGYAGPIYNYNTVFTGRFGTTNSAFLNDVRTTSLRGVALNELKEINPAVFVGILDCDVCSYRVTRS